jgi:hypothetical protein
MELIQKKMFTEIITISNELLNSKNNWAKYREPAPLIYSLTPDFLKLFCYPMNSNMDCITENHQLERPFYQFSKIKILFFGKRKQAIISVTAI